MGVQSSEPRRLLVVKLSSIGDVLLATPALRSLRRSFPEAHIAALVAPPSDAVLRGSDLVDELIVFDKFAFDSPRQALTPSSLLAAIRLFRRLRGESFDAVAIMHHLTTRWGALKYRLLASATGAPRRAGLDNGRGRFLTERVADGGFGARHEAEYALAVAAALGADARPYPLEMAIDEGAEAFAQDQLPSGRRYIAIHPGSGDYSPARRWAPDRFAEVGRELARRYDAMIVLVGGPGEEGLAAQVASGLDRAVVDLAGRTDLRQLAGVLKRCSLFIGNDSGVMHLAVAVGTPVVAVFGPSNHLAWGPWYGDGRVAGSVVRLDMACSPCLYVGHSLGLREGCPARTCLADLPSEMVISAAEQVLEGHG